MKEERVVIKDEAHKLIQEKTIITTTLLLLQEKEKK